MVSWKLASPSSTVLLSGSAVLDNKPDSAGLVVLETIDLAFVVHQSSVGKVTSPLVLLYILGLSLLKWNPIVPLAIEFCINAT